MATYMRCLYSCLNRSQNLLKVSLNLVNKKITVSENVIKFHSSSAALLGIRIPHRFYSLDSPAAEADKSEDTDEVKEQSSRPVVDVETSKRYLKSDTFKKTYGEALVWQPYRRNHKGHLPPRKIRRSCYGGGKLQTGNPCPICRDEYLVLHPENVDLLKQFISPYTGEIISNHVTNLCRVQHQKLLVCIEQAWDVVGSWANPLLPKLLNHQSAPEIHDIMLYTWTNHHWINLDMIQSNDGSIEKAIPFREYKYEEYYPELKKKSSSES